MKLRNKKTGEIMDKICVHICSFDVNGNECKEIDTETRSLEKVLETWEDYKPKEPLIKDEKIRKAVRAWAEAVNTYACKYDEFWKEFRFNNCNICFKGKLDAICSELKDGEHYTIAELCGEGK